MSVFEAENRPDAVCDDSCAEKLSVLQGSARDLGGFSVRRVLPQAKRRMVGPFVFFDHLGPAEFDAGKGIDVRPHPHIGLSTVTYLFEGGLMHRDSLGYQQRIMPGALNWMTAGSGIVHSERSPEDLREAGHCLHAIQSWVALPKEAEEVAPSFVHHAAEELPEFAHQGAKMRLIAGEAYGYQAPVKVHSPLFYLDIYCEKKAAFDFPEAYQERAIYVVTGSAKIHDVTLNAGEMALFPVGDVATIQAEAETRMMALGGEPLPEKRHIWWNFVSSDKARIEQAKRDWDEGRFEKVPGEEEFIPLPER